MGLWLGSCSGTGHRDGTGTEGSVVFTMGERGLFWCRGPESSYPESGLRSEAAAYSSRQQSFSSSAIQDLRLTQAMIPRP